MFKGFISHNRSPKEKKEKISKEEFEIVEQYNYNL